MASVTYASDTNRRGRWRSRQVPFRVDGVADRASNPSASALGETDGAVGNVAAHEPVEQMDEGGRPDVVRGLSQLVERPPAVPGDERSLELLLPVGVDHRMRDPEEEERVGAEEQRSVVIPLPEARRRPDDRAELVFGAGEPGLLRQLPQ